MKKLLLIFLCSCLFQITMAQNVDDGFTQPADGFANSGLDRRRADSTKVKKEIPKGLKVWTVDAIYGDRIPSSPDTLSHLFQNSIFTNGRYGESNNLGNVGSPSINRIFIDRLPGNDFIFTDPYRFFVTTPDQIRFTNTLSPVTNLSYNGCGSTRNGEDSFKALFAVNIGKKIGVGFKFDYVYGKGYYKDVNTAHFNYSLFGSYLGERYQAHLFASFNHEKVSENGGIINDETILHPESFTEGYSEEEIPTTLENNWNRFDNQTIFFTHRYSLGFSRKVSMTEEEIKAKKFAIESKKKNDAKKAKEKAMKELGDDFDDERYEKELAEKAKLEVEKEKAEPVDTSWTKDEYVPVTSFIHTADLRNYRRIYQAYSSPQNYYADTHFNTLDDGTYGGDSIFDKTNHFVLRNTLAVAMLEGFNKWVPMGLKIFAAHQVRRTTLPNLNGGMDSFSEFDLSVGGQLCKTAGRRFHYAANLEAYVVGDKAGNLLIDGDIDYNFPLFGDTVTLKANGFFHREKPTFYYRKYHSKHLWWDNDDLSAQLHFRAAGTLDIGKTKTKIRFAYDNINNLTYFATSNETATDLKRIKNTVSVRQGSNVSLFTIQLAQHLNYGILNFETLLTFQKSTNKDVLPVPVFNAYANLYLKFRIAKVL
ncbi:MAG: putative porin, partial [Bacteroidaceae bacterium]|nr:putative porin [Bacteroidaceae bacterium]